MRLTHHSSKLRIRALATMVIGLLATALAVNAQANISHTLTPNDYVVEPSAGRSNVNPRTPQGEGAWTSTSAINAPAPRSGQSTVWTGTEMIIWGGNDGSYGAPSVNTGARYNPTTDTWQTLSTVGAPPANSNQPTIWTGKEMIIGIGGGGRYNPTTDSWRPITTTGSPMSGDIVIWTGHEMLVWQKNGTGARYDPELDRWRPMSSVNGPIDQVTGMAFSTALGVWTGREMVVFFACAPAMFIDCGGYTGTGGRYDLDTDTWRSMSVVNAPLLKQSPGAAVWTGKEMVVYGGFNNYSSPPGPNMGGKYNPYTDTWTPITPLSDFAYSDVTTAIWTGAEIVFAGRDPFTPNTRMARYDPVTDQWLGLPPPTCNYGSLVWTGKEVLLWGANTYAGCYIYDNAARRFTIPNQTTQASYADYDSYLAQGQPTSAFGSEQLLWSGYDPQFKYYTERALTHFPLVIPSRAIVTQASAYLYLYAYSNGATPMNIAAHRMTVPWTESSTWQTAANGYDPSPASTLSIYKTFGWYTWNVTPIVQKWVNGTASNYGLMFNGNESGVRNERVFIAREANTAYTPFLAVTYTDPFYAADTAAPTAAIKPMSTLQPTPIPLSVQWSGSDQGRGVQSFDVQVRDNGDSWADWYTWAAGTSAPFVGQDGHTYCFRVRARDYAGNVGSYATAPGCVTFYGKTLTLTMTDSGHAPIADAAFDLAPAPLGVDTLATGRYQAYVSASPSYQLTVTHPYLVAPPTAVLDQATDEYTVVLQPTDNVIQNANFESDLSDWTISGTLPVSTTNFSHSGSGAARFDGSAATQSTPSLSQTVLLPDVEQPLYLSFLYALTGTLTNPFTVDLITTGAATQVFSTTEACPTWCHKWIDVSAWRNQTVTLVFQLNQAAGESTQLTLDEVTLGTWQTPIIAQVTPTRVDAHTLTTITLTGQNFLAQPLSAAYITGPIVLLNSTPVDTYWINTTTLSATLPLTLPFGLYDVWVANPGGYRGELPAALRIGHGVYLPVISK